MKLSYNLAMRGGQMVPTHYAGVFQPTFEVKLNKKNDKLTFLIKKRHVEGDPKPDILITAYSKKTQTHEKRIPLVINKPWAVIDGLVSGAKPYTLVYKITDHDKNDADDYKVEIRVLY